MLKIYINLSNGNTPEHEVIERLAAGHRGIYLLCHQSARDSKLAVVLGKLSMHGRWQLENDQQSVRNAEIVASA